MILRNPFLSQSSGPSFHLHYVLKRLSSPFGHDQRSLSCLKFEAVANLLVAMVLLGMVVVAACFPMVVGGKMVACGVAVAD